MQINSLLIYFFKVLFFYIFYWLYWVFVAPRGLSLVAASKSYSSLQCTSYCGGFSHYRAQALGAWAQ